MASILLNVAGTALLGPVGGAIGAIIGAVIDARLVGRRSRPSSASKARGSTTCASPAPPRAR